MGLWSWGVSIYRSSVKGTWRENSLAGDPEGYVEKDVELSSHFIGALMGNLEVGSCTGDFERWMKAALGMECYSLKRPGMEGLWGGFLFLGLWKIC
jgi:hypothetical protein